MGCPCPSGYSNAGSTTIRTWCSNGTCNSGGTVYTKVLWAAVVTTCKNATTATTSACDSAEGCCT